MSLFQDNLAILEKILPDVARSCQSTQTAGYETLPSRQGNLTLRKKEGNKTAHFHSSYDPVKEAGNWFSSLKLSNTKVLFIYGVGLGYYYDAAKPWLDESPDHYLVFLEDDIAALNCFLNTSRATTLLHDRQVQLHHFASLAQAEAMVDWILWYFIQQPLEVSGLEYYQREKADTFNALRRTLTQEAVVKNAMVAEYLRHGAAFFHNYYGNLLHLPQSASGNALFGQFQNVPAIICGAGPSLKKNMDQLAHLKDKALLFAGGSSVNALTAAGIIPHFGGGIDPNPPQLERLLTNQAFEVPFFYRGRMFHEAFNAISGKRLHITGSGGYSIADWIEEKLDISGTFIEEGHNVINFLMEIAAHMGCNPIIFVGMDLAYTNMEAYAPGVIANASVDTDTIRSSKDMDSAAFPRPDIHGEPVYTLWKWVSEAGWISDFAKEHPSTRLINATEGGLGFNGIPNTTLKEASSLLPRQQDLSARVHAAIASATMPQVTEEKVLTTLKELKASLLNIVNLCDSMNQEIDQLTTHKESAKTRELENRLTSEAAYSAILAIFNDVFSKVLQREMYQVYHDKSLKTPEEINKAQLQVQKRKFQFLRDTASTNLEVMQKAIGTFAKEGYDTTCFQKPEAKS